MDGKKIYPSAEQLKTVSTVVKCQEKDCGKIFSSFSNLTLHLSKTHKMKAIMPTKENREFHCPETDCMYHANKFFKAIKQLKQHYLKVHASKDIVCESCHKGFATSSQHVNHIEYCGVLFSCFECNIQYPSYETLLTHARRKGHKILQKSCFAKNPWNVAKNNKKGNTAKKPANQELSVCQLLILPVNGEQNLKFTHGEKNTISTQTYVDLPKYVVKKIQIGIDKPNTKRFSQETQTSARKKPKLTVETQTVGQYSSKKKTNPSEILSINASESLARKSIKTQTNVVPLKSTSCNTSFSFNDMDFTVARPMECNTSSTQTYSDSLDICATLTGNDTLADTSSIIDFNTTFDSNFCSCNSETQTDMNFEEDLFNCDYYSNTHTQTSEDMLLGDIGFSDIETQTVIEDILRSVESQTLMSHTMKNSSNYRDMSHIETQTDVEFKKMLEEINS